MQIYYYGFWLLAVGVVLINSKVTSKSIDNGEDENISKPNNNYLTQTQRAITFANCLKHLLSSELLDDKSSGEAISFERRRKGISKGDPREFMG